jgi:hypothetical protein
MVDGWYRRLGMLLRTHRTGGVNASRKLPQGLLPERGGNLAANTQITNGVILRQSIARTALPPPISFDQHHRLVKENPFPLTNGRP